MSDFVDNLQKTLVFQQTAPATELLDGLAKIRELDKESEQKQWHGIWICLAGLPFIVIGVAMALAWESPLPLPIAVLGLGLFIGGIIYRALKGRLNLEDRRYEMLAAMVDMLRRDMLQDAAMQVKVDFNSPMEKKNFKSKGKVGLWDVKFYEDVWLSLGGRFQDGTAFDLSITELTQYRTRWARSRSGKSKHKCKTKSATVAELRLKPKSEKYPGLTQHAQAVSTESRVPEWCMLKRAQLTPKGLLSMKISTKMDWDVPSGENKNTAGGRNGVEMVALLFLSLYRILNHSRESSPTEGFNL